MWPPAKRRAAAAGVRWSWSRQSTARSMASPWRRMSTAPSRGPRAPRAARPRARACLVLPPSPRQREAMREPVINAVDARTRDEEREETAENRQVLHELDLLLRARGGVAELPEPMRDQRGNHGESRHQERRPADPRPGQYQERAEELDAGTDRRQQRRIGHAMLG